MPPMQPQKDGVLHAIGRAILVAVPLAVASAVLTSHGVPAWRVAIALAMLPIVAVAVPRIRRN